MLTAERYLRSIQKPAEELSNATASMGIPSSRPNNLEELMKREKGLDSFVSDRPLDAQKIASNNTLVGLALERVKKRKIATLAEQINSFPGGDPVVSATDTLMIDITNYTGNAQPAPTTEGRLGPFPPKWGPIDPTLLAELAQAGDEYAAARLRDMLPEQKQPDKTKVKITEGELRPMTLGKSLRRRAKELGEKLGTKYDGLVNKIFDKKYIGHRRRPILRPQAA